MSVSQGRIRAALRYIRDGGASTDGLPTRVLAEIDDRERRAEQLIGWVQLSVVLFFSTLYAIAPRAEGGSGENFVPITLAVYFAFTLFRLLLSYRITMPGWFLVISIIVDVMLLCGLIFSFHIQYHQSAAFYLKAPTILYFFFFISLRALRFDPRYVLTSGIISAAGWLALVVFAIAYDMGDMHITRNYVEYMTSNSILIGAEIDKIITILGVTGILSLALYRGRQVLFDATQSHAAAEDLKRFFAPDVASSITGSDHLPTAGHGETRDAGILFLDVRSFTKTAETMPPEAVMQVLGHYQEVALGVIQRHGGQIDKFMGDGILATFGAVQPSETYAADAMRAVREALATLDREEANFATLGWPGTFSVGGGVACGPVTVGVVGARDRLEFTVIGNAVNLAAKLESANKRQVTRAMVDAASFDLAKAQGFEGFALGKRRGLAVAGLSRPLDVVVLV